MGHAACCLPGCGDVFPAWGRTIKIGVIGPRNCPQGKGHWGGATMAMEEITARGGVQVGNEKMKIELVKADSNEFLNVTDATNAMERLMTQDKVDFVVGGFRTEAVLAMQDIAMDYKKIFIGCGAAHSICDRVAKIITTNIVPGTPSIQLLARPVALAALALRG
jgi:branched-chain amino acid transport system substrate-binding protein